MKKIYPIGMCWFSQVCTQFPFFSRPSLLPSTDSPRVQTPDIFFPSVQSFSWGTHPSSGFVIIFIHCYDLHFHASAPFMFMSITNLLSTTFHTNSRAGSMFLNICSWPCISSYSQPLFSGLAELSANTVGTWTVQSHL